MHRRKEALMKTYNVKQIAEMLGTNPETVRAGFVTIN